jgi:hypothetical protein
LHALILHATIGSFVAMQISTLLRRGESHPTHCEDALIIEHLSSDLIAAAVFDGCSMGTDSHFAATLLGKLLKKSASLLRHTSHNLNQEEQRPQAISKILIRDLFNGLKTTRNELFLERNETLSTLIVAVYKPSSKALHITFVGDGAAIVNGKIADVDDDNKPDYLAYHLGEQFDDFYNGLQHLQSYEDVTDFSICTDGIWSFKNFEREPFSPSAPINLLGGTLANNLEVDSLERICRALEHSKHFAQDDLAMIRIQL